MEGDDDANTEWLLFILSSSDIKADAGGNEEASSTANANGCMGGLCSGYTKRGLLICRLSK